MRSMFELLPALEGLGATREDFKEAKDNLQHLKDCGHITAMSYVCMQKYISMLEEKTFNAY